MKKRIFFVLALFFLICVIEQFDTLSQGVILLEWGLVWMAFIVAFKLDELFVQLFGKLGENLKHRRAKRAWRNRELVNIVPIWKGKGG